MQLRMARMAHGTALHMPHGISLQQAINGMSSNAVQSGLTAQLISVHMHEAIKLETLFTI